MTVNLNTYSDISSITNTIYERAMFVARDNNVAVQLVTNLSATGSQARKNEIYGSATINSIGESDDLTSQAFTPSVLSTLTPAEVGAQFFLSDQRIETDINPAINDAASELGMALATKIESDILGNFNAMTTNGTIGTSGSVLTWNYFYAMLATLRNAKAPLPYAFVCSPYQYYQLGRAAAVGNTVANSPKFQDTVMEKFYVGSAAGVDIFVSANVETATNDAYAGMFSPAAIALDMRRAPRLERERDASRRGWELNMTSVYAHGVWRPAFGVCGIFSNSAVTGV